MNFVVILFLILKNTIYGLSVFVTGNLTETTDALDILSIRFLLSFIFLLLFKSLKIIKININLKDFFRKNEQSKYLKYLLLTGLFEPVLYMFFETVGIAGSTGITTAVILSLDPIFSCIAESVFLKEKSPLLKKIFLGFGILGVVYISLNTNTNDGRNTAIGILSLIAAVISGVMFQVFSRKSSKNFNAFEVSYVSCLMGAVIFNSINVVRHIALGSLNHYFDSILNTNNLMGYFFLSFLSTIIATSINNYALSKVQVTSVSAFGGISTLVTVAAGVIFGGEKLYLYHIIGLSLIIVRMAGVSYIDIKNQKTLMEKKFT